jgi:hypothetical protein
MLRNTEEPNVSMKKNNDPTKEEVIKAAQCVPSRGAKEGWCYTLDKEEGSLYYSPERLPSDARLFQVSKEFAVYVDSKKQAQGFMIEYVNANFLKHHTEFKDIYKELFESPASIKKAIVTIKPSAKKKEAVMFKRMLDGVLIEEMGLENSFACAC